MVERGNHRYNLIVKYRQGGVTTLYIIDELDEALWVPGMTCGIIAHEAKKLPEYFNIAKLAFQYLPIELKPKTKTDTKYMYEFTHRFDGVPLDSSIYIATDVRGGTVQKLHITESAYIKDRAKLKSGSKQAVPLTGWISEETTGNGFNDFYDDYIAARDKKDPGEYDYRAFFYAWVENPEYTLPGHIEDAYSQEEDRIKQVAKDIYNIDVTDGQLLWRRWKMSELHKKQEGIGLSGDQLFKQEYPLTITEAFQSGAGNIFDPEKVEVLDPVQPMAEQEGINYIRTMHPNFQAIEDKFKSLYNRGIWFWELPKVDYRYLIGVDPSDGEGADYGPINVWKKPRDQKEKYEQVAQFYGKARPDELAQLAVDMALFYNEAFLGIENNMLSTILFASKIYDNYYFETEYDRKTMKRTKHIGWNTNSKSRDIVIDGFIILFEENNLLIRSRVTIAEMRTFVKNADTGKREHAVGKHDDSLFADFIALQMRLHDAPRSRAFYSKPAGL